MKGVPRVEAPMATSKRPNPPVPEARNSSLTPPPTQQKAGFLFKDLIYATIMGKPYYFFTIDPYYGLMVAVP